jgi:ADP-ribose pyrophosphatase YjhB (NUDIX family)
VDCFGVLAVIDRRLPGHWRRLTPAQSLVKAIRCELYEETGLRVEIGFLLGVLDRRDKDSITLLFAAVPNNSAG